MWVNFSAHLLTDMWVREITGWSSWLQKPTNHFWGTLTVSKKAMQDEWHVMHGSASAFWTEGTFQFWMQMQIQERVGLLLGPHSETWLTPRTHQERHMSPPEWAASSQKWPTMPWPPPIGCVKIHFPWSKLLRLLSSPVVVLFFLLDAGGIKWRPSRGTHYCPRPFCFVWTLPPLHALSGFHVSLTFWSSSCFVHNKKEYVHIHR
jgi:hypothetical protein